MTKNYRYFPWLLVLYEVLIYLSMDAYMPAFPMIADDFHASANIVQLTATAWMFGALSVQLLFGPLSDRYGRRPILLLSGVIYIVSTTFCMMATNIHFLLVARFFQGSAMPAMYIAGYAAINEYFDSNQAIKILARMNGATILAPAFGPILGSMALLFVAWRWIFVALGIAAGVTILALFFYMPETLASNKRAKQLHAGNIIRQYKMVLTNKRFIISAFATFLPIVGLIAWMLTGPFLVLKQFQHSTVIYGVVQAFIFAGFILGTKLVKKYASNRSNQRLINLGIACALMGAMAAVLVAFLLPYHLVAFVVAMMVMTFGAGIAMPILSRLTLEKSDAPMGIRVTIFSSIRIGAGFIGTICVSLFYSGSTLSIALVMLVFIIIAAALRVLILN